MVSNILSGKIVADQILADIKSKVSFYVENGMRKPCLAAILVGDDPASETYIRNKLKTCAEINYESKFLRLDASIHESDLIELIKEINQNPEIDGLIVQSPLPKHINEKNIILAIDPDKDVDGFHPINLGKIALEMPGFISATPGGILEFFKYYNIDTLGKHAVIIGRSNLVGTPLSILLSRNTNPGNCTVTLCHSKTKNLADITKTADILIAAIGKPGFVKADMIKQGAVIFDVGINRIISAENKSGYKLIGDVDFIEVAPKCEYITPVPGGVGLTTIAMLMKNTLQAYEKNITSN